MHEGGLLAIGMSGFYLLMPMNGARPTASYLESRRALVASLDTLSLGTGQKSVLHQSEHHLETYRSGNTYYLKWRIRDSPDEYDEQTREDLVGYDFRTFVVHRLRTGFVSVERSACVHRKQRDSARTIVLSSDDMPETLRSLLPWRRRPVDVVTLSSEEMQLLERFIIQKTRQSS